MKVQNELASVHPFILGILIMVIGLVLDQGWWKIGGIILIVLFLQAVARYRPID